MLGPVLMDVLLPIPPANSVNGDETLGSVLMDVVLSILPVNIGSYCVNYWGWY